MGLTDDKALYISTCRNITLWNLNNFYNFWGVARNQVSRLALASCEEKTTRVVAVGEDSRSVHVCGCFGGVRRGALRGIRCHNSCWGRVRRRQLELLLLAKIVG